MKTQKNWIHSLERDLKRKLNLYFSHYPELIGKTAKDFVEEKQIIENMISSSYKWETNESLVTITINIKSLAKDNVYDLLDEMSIFIQERIKLLRKKDYLIIIEDGECRWNVIDSMLYSTKVPSKNYNVFTLSILCSSFHDLVEICEDNKIALKCFYKVEKDKINQLFFVNSFWIV